MACWERPALSLALAAAALGLPAGAAHANVPLLDVGAHASAGYHVVPGGALDVTAGADVRGLALNAQYWRGLGLFGAAALPTLVRAHVGYNLSPVPMIRVAPAVGVAVLNGAVGGEGNLTAAFTPFLLPLGLEAQVGAQYYPSLAGMLLPYHVGARFSPLPFTSLALRYRGWAGSAPTPLAGVGGPEIALEIGI